MSVQETLCSDTWRTKHFSLPSQMLANPRPSELLSLTTRATTYPLKIFLLRALNSINTQHSHPVVSVGEWTVAEYYFVTDNRMNIICISLKHGEDKEKAIKLKKT